MRALQEHCTSAASLWWRLLQGHLPGPAAGGPALSAAQAGRCGRYSTALPLPPLWRHVLQGPVPTGPATGGSAPLWQPKR